MTSSSSKSSAWNNRNHPVAGSMAVCCCQIYCATGEKASANFAASHACNTGSTAYIELPWHVGKSVAQETQTIESGGTGISSLLE